LVLSSHYDRSQVAPLTAYLKSGCARLHIAPCGKASFTTAKNASAELKLSQQLWTFHISVTVVAATNGAAAKKQQDKPDYCSQFHFWVSFRSTQSARELDFAL
jgi:hypothetical protein